MGKLLALVAGLALMGAGSARAADHIIRFGSDHAYEQVVVDVGEIVRWDGDFLAHPLVSDADLHSTVRDGSTFALMFRRPGVYRYHCANHPGVEGVIRVGGTTLSRAHHTTFSRASHTWHDGHCGGGHCGYDACCVW